jgi:hypothetical protein
MAQDFLLFKIFSSSNLLKLKVDKTFDFDNRYPVGLRSLVYHRLKLSKSQ